MHASRLFISILCSMLLAACGSAGSNGDGGASVVTAAFSPSMLDFPNPERGFYRFAASDFASTSLPVLQGYVADGLRLVYAPVRLDAYRDTDQLPDAFMTALQASFGKLRQAGLKAVLRVLYDDTSAGLDAPLDRVLLHIRQLKPLLQENADVIAFWQAGFIGAWGEWHDSSNGLTSDANKLAIRDALLDALPAGRFLQMRDPGDIRLWYPAAAAEADLLAAGPKARIGMHNDCFLASQSDVGAYGAGLSDPLRDYVKSMTAVTPFGGETCDPTWDATAVPRTGCADILAEGRAYHLSYLNSEYYTPLFHDNWKAQGCYEEVSRSMGYRIELLAAHHPASVARGAAFALKLELRNAGWARIANPRDLVVTLRERATGQEIASTASGVDPRSLLPGQSYTIDAAVAIPAGAAAGDYQVLVSLPDPAPRLRADARYAIRPANADDPGKGQTWDAARGQFGLGTAVAVK